MPQTTVIIPCYNEATRIDRQAFLFFLAQHSDIRLLFVNDGSTDSTHQVLEGIASETPANADVLALERNSGKAEAVRRGVLHAIDQGAAFVGFWDADLATPLEDILLFRGWLEVHPAFDVVIGSRVNLMGRSVHRNLLRHYVGRVFATAAVAVLRLPIYDTQCGAKLFRVTPQVREVFARPFLSPWIFDIEIFARLRNALSADRDRPATTRIFEMPLMVWRDVAGSKLRLRHFMTVGWDLVRIHFRYNWNL